MALFLYIEEQVDKRVAPRRVEQDFQNTSNLNRVSEMIYLLKNTIYFL